MIKSMKMIWVGHVARMEGVGERIVYRERDHYKYLDVDGWIILRLMWRDMMG
jgi:hypothetical protein